MSELVRGAAAAWRRVRDKNGTDVYRRYPHLLDELTAALRPLLVIPLPQMREANELMQTLAPMFVRPLDYHAGATNLAQQRRVIDAAAALQDLLYELAGQDPAGGEEPRTYPDVPSHTRR